MSSLSFLDDSFEDDSARDSIARVETERELKCESDEKDKPADLATRDRGGLVRYTVYASKMFNYNSCCRGY